MKWNDGLERALFKKEQKRLRKEYAEAGMTEGQINSMLEFDLEWYKSRRREAIHTQRLDIQTSEDEDINKDNPLYKKFFEKLAVEDKHEDFTKFGWVEQIESKKLYEEIISLSENDMEILTMLIEGFTQTEIATKQGVSQQAISKRLKKFQTIFQRWL